MPAKESHPEPDNGPNAQFGTLGQLANQFEGESGFSLLSRQDYTLESEVVNLISDDEIKEQLFQSEPEEFIKPDKQEVSDDDFEECQVKVVKKAKHH